MAQQQSSTVALSSQAQHDMRDRQKEIAELEERIKTLEAAAQKDKHIVKEVKKQVKEN